MDDDIRERINVSLQNAPAQFAAALINVANVMDNVPADDIDTRNTISDILEQYADEIANARDRL